MFLRIVLSIVFVGAIAQLLFAQFSTDSHKNRERIRIVGSSTVFPFATVAAEYFGKKTGYPTPIIEATGTGGGMQAFCSGIGSRTPDIANASRKIKDGEVELCKKNGVTDILEVPLGYDGLVIAGANKSNGVHLNITKRQLFLALASKIPQNGKLIENPYKNWSDIDKSLPNRKIKVLGPPPTSGTRDSFSEMIMEEGCKDWDEAIKLGLQKEACRMMREDGHWQDMGENDNLIVQKVNADPDNVGIFGYAYYRENRNILKATLIDNVAPTIPTILDKTYSVSRPLYMYVKKQHFALKAGMALFLREVLSDDAMSNYGYLPERGLIPLPIAKRDEVRKEIPEETLLQD